MKPDHIQGKSMKNILISSLAVALLCLASAGHASQIPGVSADHPSPSPSGAEVVFAADYNNQSNLWISGTNGQSLRQLTTGTNVDMEPAWSPDGTRIAYSSRSDANRSDIWVIQKDGTGLTRLTSDLSGNWEPVWSPDGTKIAFVSDRHGSNDIWIMNANGSAPRPVISLPGQENHPSFSPNGSEIVFSHTVDQASLKIVKVDGTGLRTLTSGSSRDWNPNWSKYGIVFSAQRSSEYSTIWVVQGDGTGLRQLGDIPTTEPVWMPDGRVLFSNQPENSAALTAISIFDPKTGTKQVVTTVQGYQTAIDIRPGKMPNLINPASLGKVEVTVLSTRTFDATKAVAQSSITFGRTGSEKSLADCSKTFKDMNSDGLPDLTCRFWLRNADFQAGSTIGVLRFKDAAQGIPYEGRDTIVITSKDDPDDFK